MFDGLDVPMFDDWIFKTVEELNAALGLLIYQSKKMKIIPEWKLNSRLLCLGVEFCHTTMPPEIAVAGYCYNAKLNRRLILS